jgi:hypothetical protein
MQYRHLMLPAAALVLVSLQAQIVPAAFAQAPASAPATTPASRPAASQPVIPSDPASIREMVLALRSPDSVLAADAAVKLKLLAKRGVPVWDHLEDSDPTSARHLLTWLRDHPGNIHHPSALRIQWEAMDVYKKDVNTGKSKLMGNAELVEYGRLARELIRDGDPFGYYAILDVARTATELLGNQADHVTFAYVVPYLDRHLDMHLTLESLKNWKGFWSKPITEKRKFKSPLMETGASEIPSPPHTPWEIPGRILLAGLDAYRDRLADLGLWQDPPWLKEFTARTSTADLLKALNTESFPVRQHICRLLRARMADADDRMLVVQAIEHSHPRMLALGLVLKDTLLMPYADAIRKAWPKELDEQCPGTIDDLLSPVLRRQAEASIVIQETLLYWPDRTQANRWASRLWDAAGAGETLFSILALLSVDNKEGVDKLLAAYRDPKTPDSAYNSIHRWANTSATPFRTACADKDLAPLIIKITTATQPAVDTSKQDWSQILRMAYEVVWWRLNADKLYWNEETNRLEVPQDQLVRPTEEQVLASYSDRSALFRQMMDAAKTRKLEWDPRKDPDPRKPAAPQRQR